MPQKLIQLGWSQFAAVSAALLALLAVLWIIFGYEWQELYYREFAVPRLQAKYGFRLGPVKTVREGTTYLDGKGVVDVAPRGEFDRIGVRPGDVPFNDHDGAFTSLYYALEAAAHGEFSAFDVVNVHDFSAGAEGFRTIAVNPRVREVPVPMTNHTALRSPTGPLTVIAFDSDVDGTPHELWTWDPVGGSRRRLHEFGYAALATWSADSNWLAVTVKDFARPSRCLLSDIQGRRSSNLTDALKDLPPSMRPGSSDRVECEIFGWVLEHPSQLAVIFRDLGASAGEKWIYDFLFDVSARRLLAVERR